MPYSDQAVPPTNADVARAAGVSAATVSQILNGRGQRFSAPTQERVQQAARELGYQPSAAARMLARGASELVVALIPRTTWSANLQELVDTWTDGLSAVGLTLVLRFSNSSPESFDRLVRTMRPLAVMTMTRLSDGDRQLLRDRNVRLIEPQPGQAEHFDDTIGRMQAEYLISRGHTRLAYARLSDARADLFGRARETGFRAACGAHDLPAPATLTLPVDATAAQMQLAGLELPGYGIACYSDDLAITLLHAAQRLGWRVPEDVALIGMDHTPVSTVTNPRLTTIDADIRAAGPAMTRAILDAIRDRRADDRPFDSPVSLRVVEGGTA
jgi:DNA-binding LacI/PurR family transcriptional regulator